MRVVGWGEGRVFEDEGGVGGGCDSGFAGEHGFGCVGGAGVEVGAAGVDPGGNGGVGKRGLGKNDEAREGEEREGAGLRKSLGSGEADADAGEGAGAGDDSDGSKGFGGGGEEGGDGWKEAFLGFAGGEGLGGVDAGGFCVEEGDVVGGAAGVEEEDCGHGFQDMEVWRQKIDGAGLRARVGFVVWEQSPMLWRLSLPEVFVMVRFVWGVVVASIVVPVVLVAQAADAGRVVLPIRRVSLYKNGVGFFEHAGTVRGDQAVRIDFTTAQLNDVLQSLTAVDLGGGRIAGAGYNSTTPLEQQLKSLPLGLAGDAGSVDLYGALRGARVEVTGAGAAVTGRILNVELRDVAGPLRAAGEEMPMAQRHFLTVVSDAGVVRTVELTGATSVRLLDGALRGDVDRYLETLAGNHAEGLRHLTLMDKGVGARELRVSYVSEVPVWKCTYRILFDGTAGASPKTATLQGWAVIDNTVGTDWDGVQLSLVSGAPQSFLQPISQPYYARRPEVGLPEEAQLTPQTHESGVEVTKVVAALDALTAPGSVPAVSSGVVGAGMGPGMGPAGGVMGGLGLNVASSAQQTLAGFGRGVGQSSGNGMGVGVGHGSGGGSYSAGAAMAYEDSAAASVVPQTSTASFDDYFEYTLNEPVTIKKNASALVPILQAKVEVDPVTLWSPNEARPLRALWVKNTSGLTLDRGSFSIVQGGNFSGQGLLDPIHPGERRLLSYAVDSAVRVTVDHRNDTRKLQQVTVAKGILREKTAEVAEVEYLVHNAAAEARTVIVEQPRRMGWELDSEPKPEETTAGAYRFRVVTGAGETVRLRIGERHTLTTRYALAGIDEGQLTVMLRQNGDPADVLRALQPVFAAKRRLAEIDLQTAQRNAEMQVIAQDQNRLRENLKSLKGTAEERDLTRRYTGELSAQEDRLGVLKGEVAGLQAQRVAAQEAVARAIEVLSLEQTVG